MPIEAREVVLPSANADDVEFSDYLRAVTLGSYTRNQSLIHLGRDTSFWHPENEPTLRRLAVFLHEYLHFTHNYSTVVGLYDFFIQLRLTNLYCSTVDKNGKSHGEAALSDASRAEVSNVWEWRKHLRGSVDSDGLAMLRRAKSHPPFLRAQHKSSELTIGPQKIEVYDVIAVFDVSGLGAGQATIEIQLGGDVLMESCAVEAECVMYQRHGAAVEDVRKLLPVYPYLTARTVFEGIAGLSPSSEFLCRLCVLSLQSTDPGDAFVHLAEACKKAGPRAIDEQLVAGFLLNSKDFFERAVGHILDDGLQREVAPFVNRGPAGRGLQRMAAWANNLLSRRLGNAFFELHPIEAMPNLEPIVTMLRSLPACPVIQEIDALEDSQELLYFSEVEVPRELADEIGAAQALFDLTDAHIVAGQFYSTPPPRSRACPFFKACRAPLATTEPQTCERRPWKSYRQSAPEQCWYGAAVACSRSRLDL